MNHPPRVFISYSHDSREHKERVLALSERLRVEGVDALIDQYIENEGPPEGWPRWMDEQLRTADFVLVVCTDTYRRRIEGREEPGRGHGVAWEGHLVYQHIYSAATRNEKFIPVLLEGAALEDVPVPLQGVPVYSPTDAEGYEALYRRLTGQPRIERGELGLVRPLPPRKIDPPVPPRGISPPRAASRSIARTMAAVGTIAAAVIAVVAGLASILGGPVAYTVRVSVLDAGGRTVDHAKITTSVGGEVLPSAEGAQILIPASLKPADGKVVVRASVPEAFQQGETEIQLQGRGPVAAVVHLQKATNARVRGTVVDRAQRALAGVKVTIVGVEGHVVTNADGSFSLSAHAADGQQVQLRAEKEGYEPTLMWHPAGDAPAFLVLR